MKFQCEDEGDDHYNVVPVPDSDGRNFNQDLDKQP